MTKPKRYRVWLDKNFAGSQPSEEIIEMPENATDEECASICANCLETMISNELDTGWEEIED